MFIEHNNSNLNIETYNIHNQRCKKLSILLFREAESNNHYLGNTEMIKAYVLDAYGINRENKIFRKDISFE